MDHMAYKSYSSTAVMIKHPSSMLEAQFIHYLYSYICIWVQYLDVIAAKSPGTDQLLFFQCPQKLSLPGRVAEFGWKDMGGRVSSGMVLYKVDGYLQSCLLVNNHSKYRYIYHKNYSYGHLLVITGYKWDIVGLYML